MKLIAGRNFLFDEACGVPPESEEEIARSFLGGMARLGGDGDSPTLMGGPNAAGRILAAEHRRSGDGTAYILVRAATEAETETPF